MRLNMPASLIGTRWSPKLAPKLIDPGGARESLRQSTQQPAHQAQHQAAVRTTCVEPWRGSCRWRCRWPCREPCHKHGREIQVRLQPALQPLLQPRTQAHRRADPLPDRQPPLCALAIASFTPKLTAFRSLLPTSMPANSSASCRPIPPFAISCPPGSVRGPLSTTIANSAIANSARRSASGTLAVARRCGRGWAASG